MRAAGMVARDRRKVAVAEDEDHEEAGGRKGEVGNGGGLSGGGLTRVRTS